MVSCCRPASATSENRPEVPPAPGALITKAGHSSHRKVVDRSVQIPILCGGPSAPNGGRPSVRMGVQLNDTHTAAGPSSGRFPSLIGSDQETTRLESVCVVWCFVGLL